MKLWYSSPVIKYWVFNNIKLWDPKHCVTHMGLYCLYWIHWHKSDISWSEQHGFTVGILCVAAVLDCNSHRSMDLLAYSCNVLGYCMIWQPKQQSQCSSGTIFFNLVNILVGVSQLVWITFCTPLMLFFSQSALM